MDMMRRIRARGLALAAIVALATGSTSCGILKDKLSSRTGLPNNLRGIPGVQGLSDLAQGTLSEDSIAMIKLVGPLAVDALKSVAAALEKSAAQRRETEAREEEGRRLRIASAQLYYAQECTKPGVAGDTKGNKNDGGLEKQATEAFARADYAAAAKALKTAREQTEKKSGPDSPELARLLNKEAVVQLAMGEYINAVAPAARALKIRQDLSKAAEKGDAAKKMVAALDEAESLTTMGQIYRAAGALDDAQKNLKQALDLRGDKLGTAHLCVAEAQNNLGELTQLLGNYSPALDLYRKALTTRKKALAADHRDVAQSNDNMGSIYRTLALYDRAEGYYNQALESRRKLGADHPEVADSLHNLGVLNKTRGDFLKAEDLYKQSREIRSKKLGQGIEVAQSENALAELYFAIGDFAQAEARLQESLKIRKTKLPSDHPEIAESSASLARLYQAKGDLAGAQKAQEEALRIWKAKLGPEHPVVAQALTTLGELQVAQGRARDAEKSLTEARTIREKKLGPDHPDVADSLHQLGCAAYADRNYGKAEPFFKQAIDLRRKKLGAEHPDLAVSLSYLAALQVATGRGTEALATFREAQTISEQLVRTVGTASSESRVDALLRFLRVQEEVVYSLLADAKLAPQAAPLALSVALLRKGRSVDEAAGTSRAVYANLNADDMAKMEELRGLRSEIAHKKLSPLGNNAAELQKDYERAEQLEQDLARRSAALRAKSALPALDKVVAQVAAALPADGVLVEIVGHRQYGFTAPAGKPRWTALQYTALVLNHKGDLTAAPLGPSQAIDEAVKRYLAKITDTSEAKVDGAALGQELDKLVLAPIRPAIKDGKTLVLSLDGQLNLVPFWALHDGKAYLVDNYQLAYVTSGRDLLRDPKETASKTITLLAKPEFVKGGGGATDEAGATRGLQVVEDRNPDANTRKLALAKGALKLKEAPSPLAGTAEEAKAIRKLLPKAKLLVGAEANKEQFLGVQSPGILHVATHGLFRPDNTAGGRNSRSVDIVGGDLMALAGPAGAGDPLLSSMLLLAHVGLPLSKEQGSGVVLDPSGLATALEVASMNLWGTQLVVLSACESGRGQVDNLGQGVYGLRRALVVAGAQTLVTSLWKVDDTVTRELMTAYYRNMLGGQGRVEALRQAALAVRQKHPEPRFWAPFIAIGQGAPLKSIK
jgi:CHAT domain-containing protein